MDKTINFSPSLETNKIARPKRIRSSQSPPKKRLAKQSRKEQPKCFKRKVLLTSIEILSLISIAFCLIIMLLGYSASKFSGTGFFNSLLPFAGSILIFILFSCIFLIAWWKLRKRLQNYSELSSPTLSLFFAIAVALLINHDQFALAYGNFRTLIGGKEEVGRITIAHQIYAAYRRQDVTQLQKMINRSFPYRSTVEDAARSFDVDINLLQGIIATESSFIPRNSRDGGRGLFQLTQVPQTAMSQASKKLGTEKISFDNPRHNAFVGAATFKHYLTEMKGDLFLALLAYNIGPANGGLRSIVQSYGATDFTTIQPYLQTLPRDYPIRVLSYSLAFRLWQEKGRLLAYEEGNNAIQIQRIGIPGFNTGL